MCKPTRVKTFAKILFGRGPDRIEYRIVALPKECRRVSFIL